jgi:chemotaxis protein MotB
VSGSSRRRSRGTEEAEEHNDERWMASYMDMVTVLMCLFVVLFAMSSVDAAKFEKLKWSLSTGFGTTEGTSVDTAEGVVVPPENVGDTGDATASANLTMAEQELTSLLAIRDQMAAALEQQGIAAGVHYDITERGLTVRLMGAEAFFDGNSVDLRPQSQQVLSAVGGVLGGIPNQISVEGYADPIGSSGPFATDWELSSGRATQVVRYLVDGGTVAPTRMAAVGYGSARPVSAEGGEPARALNRRVDLLVLSAQGESVRELIPELLKQREASG